MTYYCFVFFIIPALLNDECPAAESNGAQKRIKIEGLFVFYLTTLIPDWKYADRRVNIDYFILHDVVYKKEYKYLMQQSNINIYLR